MAIQFDPFSFGVASFALAIAVVQLYWNRPQHRAQVYNFAICFVQHLLTTLAIDGSRTLHVARTSIAKCNGSTATLIWSDCDKQMRRAASSHPTPNNQALALVHNSHGLSHPIFFYHYSTCFGFSCYDGFTSFPQL